MPELPEVETFTRYFARHALGQRVARVDVRDERILTLRKETFVRKLKGRAFTSVRRHGKHLFADAGATWLHLHFGMTGDLAYYREPAEEAHVFERQMRAVVEVEDDAREPRLFGLAELLDSPDAYIEAQGLGPDPLDRKFTFARFAALLEKRRGAIKSLLMSQEILAGLGNLYVDEILYQTSIHPRRPIDRLKKEEERAVFTAMRRILREAIARHGREAELPARYLYHHREEGERCPICGGSIQRTVVFGRTTYFCGKHQR
jgi:formamidopyrimidine-DNA glycosylase